MYKPKIPGRGFGIAGMVLGIIGAVYSLSLLIASVRVLTDQVGFSNAYRSTATTGVVMMTVFVAVFGILALCFSLAALSRGYKRGQAYAGLVLSIFILLCCVMAIVACVI